MKIQIQSDVDVICYILGYGINLTTDNYKKIKYVHVT